jgi:hypothetical protein
MGELKDKKEVADELRKDIERLNTQALWKLIPNLRANIVGRKQGSEVCADKAERNRVPVNDPSGTIQEPESEENCFMSRTFRRLTASLSG